MLVVIEAQEKKISNLVNILGWSWAGPNFQKKDLFEFLTKTNNQPYLTHFSSKLKNKTAIFSPTFKVEEKKVVLFFCFELS